MLFFDPKNLFPLTGEVAAEIAPIPFGQARRTREGGDLTIVTWSALVPAVEEAAATLAARGISADVLDLRTLWPWDEEAVCASVGADGAAAGGARGGDDRRLRRRGRLPRVERLGPGGVRAVARLGQPRVPVPFAPPLEDALKPDAAKMVGAAETLLAR